MIGRLTFLTGATLIFSRLLTPHDFGVAAIVLTVVNVASVFVGTPFEEALAQRRALRRGHLRAALAASWGAGLLLTVASIPLGALIASLYREPAIFWLLPVCMSSTFFSGHTNVVTGLARRLRRFSDISKASLYSNIIGVSLSILLGMIGFGVWALILQRVFIAFFGAWILQVRIEFWTLPRWSSRLVAEMGRYASLSLIDRLADNVTYLVVTQLTGGLYGVTTLGYVNMAMRLVEPLRGAVGATSHNLAFSYFASAHHDEARWTLRLRQVIRESALVISPLFVGLAATMPILLPLALGRAWEPAIGIAIFMALGCAIALPSRLVFTALSSAGRPEYSLIANIAGVAGTLSLLVVAVNLGSISVGVSRVFGDALQAAIAMTIAPRLVFLPQRERLACIAPAWIASAAMGVLVAMIPYVMPEANAVVALMISIVAGVALYACFLRLLAKDVFDRVLSRVAPARIIAPANAVSDIP